MPATDSSSTSSRTSTSSSTSDAPARGGGGGAARALGWIRLTHPFPSVLDGIVSGAAAAIAGGSPDVIVRIAAAMTIAQLGIGTLNDVVDAPRDAGHKLGKPIPAGLVARGTARVTAAAFLAASVVLAASVRPSLGLLTLVVVGIGLAYDLALKGTAWSWLPFAVGVPILPVYGWVGATGGVAPSFAILVPAAVAAGTALAIGNALVDVERDRAAGVTSVAVTLGPGVATWIAILLLSIVAALAAGSLALDGRNLVKSLVILAIGSVPVAAAALGGGKAPAVREWAWRAEAVGLAALAVAWIATVLAGDRSV